MATPLLPVRDIDPFDLEGLLFIKFPVEIWLDGDKARRLLDDMVRATGARELTPFSVQYAFFAAHRRLTRNILPPVLEGRAIEAFAERAERLRKMGITPGEYHPRFVENGADPADPRALRWNNQVRRAELINPIKETPQGWDFGEEPSPPAVPQGWDFGEDSAQPLSSWNF